MPINPIRSKWLLLLYRHPSDEWNKTQILFIKEKNTNNWMLPSTQWTKASKSENLQSFDYALNYFNNLFNIKIKAMAIQPDVIVLNKNLMSTNDRIKPFIGYRMCSQNIRAIKLNDYDYEWFSINKLPKISKIDNKIIHKNLKTIYKLYIEPYIEHQELPPHLLRALSLINEYASTIVNWKTLKKQLHFNLSYLDREIIENTDISKIIFNIWKEFKNEKK